MHKTLRAAHRLTNLVSHKIEKDFLSEKWMHRFWEAEKSHDDEDLKPRESRKLPELHLWIVRHND